MRTVKLRGSQNLVSKLWNNNFWVQTAETKKNDCRFQKFLFCLYESFFYKHVYSDLVDLCSDFADLCSVPADLSLDFADFDLRCHYAFSVPTQIDSDL